MMNIDGGISKLLHFTQFLDDKKHKRFIHYFRVWSLIGVYQFMSFLWREYDWDSQKSDKTICSISLSTANKNIRKSNHKY